MIATRASRVSRPEELTQGMRVPNQEGSIGKQGLRQNTLRVAHQRYTSTGIVLWVSTLTVSLPSTMAETPRRPCEAMTIASHPCFFAVSIIAWYGCSCSTWTVSQVTGAAAAASFTALRYFAAVSAMRLA